MCIFKSEWDWFTWYFSLNEPTNILAPAEQEKPLFQCHFVQHKSHIFAGRNSTATTSPMARLVVTLILGHLNFSIWVCWRTCQALEFPTFLSKDPYVPFRIKAYLVLLRFSDIAIFTNLRFLTTLRQANLSASFFQEHVLTSCLCVTLWQFS
jgi:hypothetical protein